MNYKIKDKILKIITTVTTGAIIMVAKLNIAFADVTFNKEKAQSDIDKLCGPVSNFLLISAIPVSLVALGVSYWQWTTKDDEEKEQNPFVKRVKFHVFGFVLYGLSGAMLKWFTIS